MNRFLERYLAKSLLNTREHGFTFRGFLLRNVNRYLLLIGTIGLAAGLFTLLELGTAAFFILGMLLGCLLRDLGWFIAIRKSWSFNLKVTDWEKVQSLADDETGA